MATPSVRAGRVADLGRRRTAELPPAAGSVTNSDATDGLKGPAESAPVTASRALSGQLKAAARRPEPVRALRA